MAQEPRRASSGDKGVPALAGELWEMVVAYARQETLDPVRSLGRFVALGIIGSAALGLGLLLLVLALLRVLQTEATAFDGDWSWVPYLITVVACGTVAALALRAIGSQRRRASRRATAG